MMLATERKRIAKKNILTGIRILIWLDSRIFRHANQYFSSLNMFCISLKLSVKNVPVEINLHFLLQKKKENKQTNDTLLRMSACTDGASGVVLPERELEIM